MLVESGDRDASIVRAQDYRAQSEEGLPLPSVVDLSMKAAIYNGVFDASNQANSGTEHHCSTGKLSPSLDEYEASAVRFSALYSKPIDDSYDAQAWECALYYCVNEYSASVNNGDFFQTIEKAWRNDSASLSQEEDLIYRPPKSFINITANSSEFHVGHLAAKALNSFLTSAFTGSGGIEDPDAGSYFSSDVIHAFYETDDLPTRIDNLAISMSNNIRQQNNSGSQPFQGKAMKGQTHLQVRWAWLAYPAVLLAITLVYLTCVMIQTRRGRILVWKSSSLALLFHGQQLHLGGNDSLPADTLSAMGKKASDMQIGLSQNDDGRWRLVQI
ncbi:uncharacterized protein KY384_004859 [Bacidia gigantensis]|uniref:uncharacterized protein n=1 Tax=Bacidia gigantensis TaxID=2732470 RepID=UPI001D03F41F|nr:uncharacterized protein KY384_004859 [Bacidia gigantensis]KAG8530357.1 hypothetical protein KY384_004859 [Bacidia gigantensis]